MTTPLQKLSFLGLLVWTLIHSVAAAETIVIDDAQLRWVDDVLISSRDAGTVESILVKPNDEVDRNSLLIELDKDIQQTQWTGAEKQLAIAKAKSTNNINLRFANKSAQVAKKEWERAKAAAAKYARAVSQTELEKMQLQFEQAELSGEQAEHELAIHQITTELRASELELVAIKLQERSILSPLKGQVAEVLVQKGEWLNLGAPVARIVNLEQLRVVALVPEDDLFSVRKGQLATFRFVLDRESDRVVEATGYVSFVSLEVNPVNREFVIWVDIDNSKRALRPGMVGSLRIETTTVVGQHAVE